MRTLAVDWPSLGLRSLADLRALRQRNGGRVAEAKEYLTVHEVQERLRSAGYSDSLDTIRRAVDRGTYGTQGQDWYRTETGYRMVRPAAVDGVIAGRRAGS